MSDGFTPPKPTKGDAAHAIARAGLGAIPVGGAAATELLNAIVTPPLEKRRQEWMERVGHSLRRLEESKGVSLEELQNNNVFLDIALQASQTALRTSQEEKLEALRNAILNSTLNESPDESVQQMFINFIDFLTVWHLRLLALLHSPEEWGRGHNLNFSDISMGGTATLIQRAFEELRSRRDLYDQLGKDLYSRGLINGDNFHITVTAHGLMQSKTTELGKQFVNFITSPVDD
jgi:hypothetical protein